MPHFIIDCSDNIINRISPKELMDVIYTTAHSTGLFKKGDIKVRIRPYNLYTVENQQKDFIHIFGYIMQGRSIEQRKNLSEKIIQKLYGIFSDIPVISINISEFEKLTYCNKEMIINLRTNE